jgi:uncharacterized protein GlcG (DUF336 family)
MLTTALSWVLRGWRWVLRRPVQACTWLALTAVLVGCGGEHASAEGRDPTSGCSGSCAEAGVNLEAADVEQVLAQGIAEAQARGVQATLAVVDRVGNVLAVYRMGPKEARVVTLTTRVEGDAQTAISGGLEGITLPTVAANVNFDDQAAIAKAITGAFLSSEGNAFSTRTASQIVQDHFNPREQWSPAGPLFGVQFSQLACSDLMRRSDGLLPHVGPQRSPLGLSADPGGFPLYKNGTPVGGVGVMADGIYGLDRDIDDRDRDVDEAIAYAATFTFAAPIDRSADRITAGGKTLRFSDVGFSDLRTHPAVAPGFETLDPAVGSLIAVKGYFNGQIRAGSQFGQPASGIRADSVTFPDQDAFVLVDEQNIPRYTLRSGTDGGQLGAAPLAKEEVQTLLSSALAVANRARAQIRRPLGTPARVTISVCDTAGEILGIVRGRDAPVFGIDVSLQKARSAVFFSSSQAAGFLQALPDAQYLNTEDPQGLTSRAVALGGYLDAMRAFVGDPAALSDGRVAYSARALGNLSRPLYPDGINGTQPGPLSKLPGEWSVLSTGFQLDLSLNAILQHILFAAGAAPDDVTPGCAGVAFSTSPLHFTPGAAGLLLGNGLQIFPGGVPIYRGATLVGGIGVSGDGVDQDDMIAFLGLDQAAAMLGGAITNASSDRRSDVLSPRGVRLRYVQCPQAPFNDDDQQRPCDGK